MARNVLILDNEFDMGGVEKKLFEFIARVDRDRFAIQACALKRGGHFKEQLVDLGVPFHEGLQRGRFDAGAYWRLTRLLRDQRIDLVYTFGHPNTVILATLSKRHGAVAAVVVSYHAMPARTGRRLVPGYLRPFLASADAILAVADSHKRYLVDVERLPADAVEVIRNGVDTSRYRPGDGAATRAALGIGTGALVFTTVASLKPVKGIDVLLRAAAPVLRERASMRLVLVGDGPDRAGLQSLARELGVAERVMFTGIRDDVDSIYRASDVVVLSSRSEAFPNTVLEAMATGLPVVTTDVGSVREMVEDGGSALVVPPEDTAALGSAMASLADDVERRRRLGRRGREVVEEKFRIEQMCEAREQVFERLIER